MEPTAERAKYRSAAATPGLVELEQDGYRQWVPMVCEMWDCEKKIAELDATEAQINSMHRTRAESFELLKRSHDQYTARHIERLTKFLAEQFGKNSKDPLARGERLDFLTRAHIPFADWKRAFDVLPASAFSEVPADEKTEALEKLNAERERLKARIRELRCPPYLQLRGGEVVDLRLLLIESWKRKQAEVRAACCPQGFDLREAEPDCAWAYSELNIAAAIGGKLALLPATKV